MPPRLTSSMPALLVLSLCCASAGPVFADDRPFELLVVDEAGSPISNAQVEVRSRPKPQQADILVGQFVKIGPYGTHVKTDGNGRLVVRFDDRLEFVNFSIKHPGYGPYWAEWDANQVAVGLPESFTAKVETGWSVGGVVLDEQGKPVKGVTVGPSIEFRKRPGESRQLGVGTRIKTDEKGQWRFDMVPASLTSVHVNFSHPAFKPSHFSLPRDDYYLDLDDEPSEPITLDRGLSIEGRVVDSDGQPIEGAVVRSEFINAERQATTDADGRYLIGGCDERMTEVVVSAKGYAVDVKNVDVTASMSPVNFQLEPGKRVEIHIVDQNGKGLPKARIFFQMWRGRQAYFAFDHVDQYADENGVWVWEDAPHDAFTADICRPGGMQLSGQSIVARDEAYVFSPAPALIASGKVVDAKTGTAIPKFRVTPGARWKGRGDEAHWHERNGFDAKDGQYKLQFDYDYPAFLIRIEALGYQTAVSRAIMTDEGQIKIDFALKPAESNRVLFLTEEGTPAAGAKVALGTPGSQISITYGDISDQSTFAKRFILDQTGLLVYTAQPGRHQLVATHSAGYAMIDAQNSPPSEVILTPWASADGVYKIGDQPGGNAVIDAQSNAINVHDPDTANIFCQNSTTTSSDGSFRFDRLFPGRCLFGREIVFMVHEGATEVTSSVRVPYELESGQSHTILIGGSGRAVVGKLLPPDGTTEPPAWKQLSLSLRVDLPVLHMPDPPANLPNNAEAAEKWKRDWMDSDEGKKFLAKAQEHEELREKATSGRATVAADGTFRFEDMPPGNYLLSGWGMSTPRYRLVAHAVKVPPVEGDGIGKEVSVGELKLSH